MAAKRRASGDAYQDTKRKWESPDRVPVEALNEVQKLEHLLGSTASRLLETHLGIPVDRRCKKERPRKAFRATHARLLEAERAVRLTWRKLRSADLSPLVEAATRPEVEAGQMTLPLAANSNGSNGAAHRTAS